MAAKPNQMSTLGVRNAARGGLHTSTPEKERALSHFAPEPFLPQPSLPPRQSPHAAQRQAFSILKTTPALGHATQGSQPPHPAHIACRYRRPKPNRPYYPQCLPSPVFYSCHRRWTQRSRVVQLWKKQQRYRRRGCEARWKQSLLQHLFRAFVITLAGVVIANIWLVDIEQVCYPGRSFRS
jgi:hypothetical protein